MNSRIEILETMGEIVQAIKLYERHLAGLNETIEKWKAMHMPLDWAEHKQTIYRMVIARLETRYTKQLQRLNSLHLQSILNNLPI